jgi:hypothetical protein
MKYILYYCKKSKITICKLGKCMNYKAHVKGIGAKK